MVNTFDELLWSRKVLTGTARRLFTDEFKREAVELLATSGRPLSQTAQELGSAASRQRAWRNRVTEGRGIWVLKMTVCAAGTSVWARSGRF